MFFFFFFFFFVNAGCMNFAGAGHYSELVCMKEFRSEEAFTPLATRTASRHPSPILRDYNINWSPPFREITLLSAQVLHSPPHACDAQQTEATGAAATRRGY